MEKSLGISNISLGTYEGRFGSWNNALETFFKFIEKSDTSTPETNDEVKSVKKLNSSSRTSRRINWRLRATILIKDNCICQMCGASPSKDSSVVLHVDHIKPWSKGGETMIENLQTLCSVCNIGKSDIE